MCYEYICITVYLVMRFTVTLIMFQKFRSSCSRTVPTKSYFGVSHQLNGLLIIWNDMNGRCVSVYMSLTNGFL